MNARWQRWFWCRFVFPHGGTILALITVMATARAADFTVDTFDAGINRWFGLISTLAFDPLQDNTGNGGGSCHVSMDFTTNQSAILIGTWGPGGIWESNTLLNLASYTSLEFDVKWDNRSGMSLAGFNHPPSGGYSPISISSLKPGWVGQSPALGTFTIPDAATNGWMHISIPINPTTPDVDPSQGLWFQKYIQIGSGTASLWLDNVRLKRLCGDCIPYPLLSLRKAVPGLNLFAGGTSPYGRQSIRTAPALIPSSWVGAGQMTYSFTVSSFSAATTNFQMHLFLIPNAGDSTAPDWHEPDVLEALLLPRTDGSCLWEVAIKTNGVPDCSTTCVWPAYGRITNSTPLGTWSLTFTANTNMTLAAPDGRQLGFVVPANVVERFAAPLAVYCGVMACDTASLGGSIVLSQVQLIADKSTLLRDDFSGGLDTNLWQVIAADPVSVQPVSTNAWWLNWTVPDAGFALATNANLANPTGWGTNALPASVQIGNRRYTLLTTNPLLTPRPLDFPSSGGLFFRLQR